MAKNHEINTYFSTNTIVALHVSSRTAITSKFKMRWFFLCLMRITTLVARYSAAQNYANQNIRGTFPGVLIFLTRPRNASDNKHFTSDLPRHAEHKTLPCSFIIYYSQN